MVEKFNGDHCDEVQYHVILSIDTAYIFIYNIQIINYLNFFYQECSEKQLFKITSQYFSFKYKIVTILHQ